MKFEPFEKLTDQELEQYDYANLESLEISFKDFDILLEMFETHIQVTSMFHKKVEETFLRQGIKDNVDFYVTNKNQPKLMEFTPSGLARISLNSDLSDYNYWESLESHVRYVIIKLLSKLGEDKITKVLKCIYVQCSQEEEKLFYLQYAILNWLPEGLLYLY
ncbi:MAG: hypothetical protein KBT48_05100 [Firmicutes bacterium]|nr:hypothetical protein [Bacillota bacterium]